jgi:hypothetical protein
MRVNDTGDQAVLWLRGQKAWNRRLKAEHHSPSSNYNVSFYPGQETQFLPNKIRHHMKR